jgi:hypothetical protein
VAVIDTELGACCCANDRNSACGNGICDAGETYSDCPLDCENPADALDRACHDYCVESGYPMGLCQNPFGQNPIWVKIAGGPSCSAGLPSNFNQTSSCYCETSQGCDSPLTDCCAAKREKIDLTKSENCCQGLVPQNPENNGKGDCMGKSCNIAVCVDQSQYCVAENYVVYPLKTQKCCAGLTAEIETTTAGATGSPVYKCKKSSACGNGICDPGETATSCPADCGGGSCYKQGETFRYQEGTCCAGLQKEYYYSTNETGPTEITIVPTSVCVKCGDGVCGKGETASNCSQDCQNQQTQTCNQACVMEGFASGSYEQTPAGFAPCICLK